jgi:hypothetical protein
LIVNSSADVKPAAAGPFYNRATKKRRVFSEDRMTLDDWLRVVGIIVTAGSLGYGLWQKRRRARLEDFVRANNWSLYNKSSNGVADIHPHAAKMNMAAMGTSTATEDRG